MAGLFEQNMKQMEGGVPKKMSIRRSTKKLNGTVLSRHKNVICIVQG